MSKFVVLSLLVLAAFLELVSADFYYNFHLQNDTRKDKLNLTCLPGKTYIIMKTRTSKGEELSDEYYDDDPPAQKSSKYQERNDDDKIIEVIRRTHMNWIHENNTGECQICVCSAEGRDVKCSRRPEANINECLYIAKVKQEHGDKMPYRHVRDLSYRVRRTGMKDYIWHRDEIPYDPKAKCYRGTSYYSNSPNANDTDIDVASDVDSLLGYANRSICFYCVCATDGNGVGCILRDPYFCDYYRFLNRDEESMRDVYTEMFGQDRPSYFRLLSYRVRRTMDQGIYDLIKYVQRPIGSCIPFVSEYTDCTDANRCTGCTRCSCSTDYEWVCTNVQECSPQRELFEPKTVDKALNSLLYEFKSKNTDDVDDGDADPKADNEVLLDNNGAVDERILSMLSRKKRSPKKSRKESRKKLVDKDLEQKKTNDSMAEDDDTIKFYHTVDELNEDTLKTSNISGTIEARKVDMSNIVSRRFDSNSKDNVTFDNPLQIEYNKPNSYNIDNKIDGNSSDISINPEQLGIHTNQTQLEKDRELSKLVVNELKIGTEYVGNKNAPIMSNITFTPENDTLTAMAFIAGNLLNKLWSIEKESGDESMEIEAMKTEKLQDLLDLFKEPLTMRQEAFLKNALESLHRAIDQHKDEKNISICESLIDAKKFMEDSENMEWEKSEMAIPSTSALKKTEEDSAKDKSQDPTAKAVSKIGNVLSLLKKYESVNKRLTDLKKNKDRKKITARMLDSEAAIKKSHDGNSLNLFGRILDKITKLLLPNKAAKKFTNKIKSINVLSNKDDKIKEKVKDTFDIDIGNASLSIKDKIILDYLMKIKSGPRALLDENISEEGGYPYMEGNILMNLSEFFKIKSFMDLVKLLDTEKHDKPKENIGRTNPDINEPVKTTTTVSSEVEDIKNTVTTKSPKKEERFLSTKDKLKAHLTTILDDLVELQKESGVPAKNGELRIADALPCIFNILNTDKFTKEPNSAIINKSNKKPFDQIRTVFDEIKKEFNKAFYETSRRMNNEEVRRFLKNTPDSALVWERVIKNANRRNSQSARRNAEIKAPVSFSEIKKRINKIESTTSSDTYKTYTKLSEVPPADKLMLLKALHAEVTRGLAALKDIKSSIELINRIPADQTSDIREFVENFDRKINLDRKILEPAQNYFSNNVELIRKPIIRATETDDMLAAKDDIRIEPSIPNNEFVSKQEQYSENKNKDIKLTKDDVLNQLIKNRILMYLKMAQKSGSYVLNDPNYNIAKNILQYLDLGNYELARQLYKIFVTTRQQTSANVVHDKTLSDKIFSDQQIRDKLGEFMSSTSSPTQVRRQSILNKQPLLTFEDPLQNLLLTARRDLLLRNLLSSKNFKLA